MEEIYDMLDIEDLTCEDDEDESSFNGAIFVSKYHPIMDDIDKFPVKDGFKHGKKINKVSTESLLIDSDDGITIKPEASNIRHYKPGKDGITGESLVRLKFLGKYAFMEEKSEFVFSERLM